jgi:23S rRNA (guanine2445-N2)-methyltransferase / 23S rRNA (guanine2069-N7)-methyltransferase
MDPELIEEYEVTDITSQTIGEDFARNAKIHYCWTIKHRKAVVKMSRKEVERPVKKVIRKK